MVNGLEMQKSITGQQDSFHDNNEPLSLVQVKKSLKQIRKGEFII